MNRRKSEKYSAPNISVRRGPQRNSMLRVAALFVVSILLLVFILHFFAPTFLFRLVSPESAALFSLRDGIFGSVDGLGGVFEQKGKILEERDSLLALVVKLESELLSLETIAQENERLREFLGRDNVPSGIVSRVLIKPYQSPYDILLVDAGANEGVLPGKKVLSNGVLLGEVTDVYEHEAKVKLYSFSDESLVAENLRVGTSLELKGKGGGNFETTVPRDFDVIPDDIFVVPGFPSHPIARVGLIESRDTDSFKKVLLSSPTNIFELQWVEIQK